MKIKEAAKYCGLTEKAIRLYESKGLIRPPTAEKNGRTYREYDAKTLRDLLTVGTLRRADFTLEQIGIMQSSPERICEIFTAYRDEIHANTERLSGLGRAMENIIIDEAMNLDCVADQLALAMLPQPSAISGDKTDTFPSSPPSMHFRHYTWDEEISADEKEAAYQQFLQKLARREKIRALFLALPRKIAAAGKIVCSKWDAYIRDEHRKIRKSVVVIFILSGLLLGLSASLISVWVKIENAKKQQLNDLYYAVHQVVYTLEHALHTGEYTYGHSEYVSQNLSSINILVQSEEYWYYNTFRRNFGTLPTTRALSLAMGCTYSATINGTPVEGILHDGSVSEGEWQFISLLCADLRAVYNLMLAEDGLNKRGDLTYESLHAPMQDFLRKWDEWEIYSEDSPYRLLTHKE